MGSSGPLLSCDQPLNGHYAHNWWKMKVVAALLCNKKALKTSQCGTKNYSLLTAKKSLKSFPLFLFLCFSSFDFQKQHFFPVCCVACFLKIFFFLSWKPLFFHSRSFERANPPHPPSPPATFITEMNENHWYVTPLQGNALLYLGLLKQMPPSDWLQALILK